VHPQVHQVRPPEELGVPLQVPALQGARVAVGPVPRVARERRARARLVVLARKTTQASLRPVRVDRRALPVERRALLRVPAAPRDRRVLLRVRAELPQVREVPLRAEAAAALVAAVAATRAAGVLAAVSRGYRAGPEVPAREAASRSRDL
jgi:hypothetical protein